MQHVRTPVYCLVTLAVAAALIALDRSVVWFLVEPHSNTGATVVVAVLGHFVWLMTYAIVCVCACAGVGKLGESWSIGPSRIVSTTIFLCVAAVAINFAWSAIVLQDVGY